MNNNQEESSIDDVIASEKYNLTKPLSEYEEVYKIESLELPDELEEKLPLLIKVYPPKTKTLKR